MNRVAQRKAQRKANRDSARAENLASEATVLESKLSAVKAKLAKVSDHPVEPKAAPVHKVIIQPGKKGSSICRSREVQPIKLPSTFANLREAASFSRTTFRRFPCTRFL
jgi:hypothetical protein